MGTGVHGVAAPSELDLWESICPDPNILLRSPARAADRVRDRDDIRRRRRTNLSQALSISYAEPLEIVRGERAYLYDATATRGSTSSTTSATSGTPTRASRRRWPARRPC